MEKFDLEKAAKKHRAEAEARKTAAKKTGKTGPKKGESIKLRGVKGSEDCKVVWVLSGAVVLDRADGRRVTAYLGADGEAHLTPPLVPAPLPSRDERQKVVAFLRRRARGHHGVNEFNVLMAVANEIERGVHLEES